MLCQSFYQYFKILTFLLISKHQRKLKRGYIGFLTKICNVIIKKSEEDTFIMQKIEQSSHKLFLLTLLFNQYF